MYTKNLPVIKELLQQGADVKLVDAHGNNPLHIACEENSIEMLELLFNESLSHYKTNANPSAMITTLTPEYFQIINTRNNQGEPPSLMSQIRRLYDEFMDLPLILCPGYILHGLKNEFIGLALSI